MEKGRMIYKMKAFDLFGFQVEIDEVATKEWYDKAEEWSCECGDCRHFVALAKKKELPSDVLDILEQIGITPEKATYVCEIITEEHKVLYQFSYRMVGNISEEKDGGTKKFGWGEVCCGHEPYPYGAPGFPTPHFDLEFWVRLPKQYKYSDIEDFLMHGREIEFGYKGRECAITNHTKRWWFYDGVEQLEVCEFENFELLVSKVAEYIVEDKTVQDIFDSGLYENTSII